MRSRFYSFSLVALITLVVSCDKKNNYSNPTKDIVREFNVKVATANENHPVTSASTFSILTIQVLSDYSISYEVYVDSAKKAKDFIQRVEINFGDPNTENGPLMAVLSAKNEEGFSKGSVTGLRNSFIDSLLNNNIPKYANVISGKEPLGLVRGQINTNIELTARVFLSGLNITPVAITTPTNGTGYLRITSDQKIYSKFIINNDEAGDEVTTARLTAGLPGQNGTDIVTIGSAPLTDPKVTPITAAQYNQLINSSFYMVVNSVLHTNGKLRGQVQVKP